MTQMDTGCRKITKANMKMVSPTASEEYFGALKWVFTKANGKREKDMATVEISIMVGAIIRVISKMGLRMAREYLCGITETSSRGLSKMAPLAKVKKSMPTRLVK